jgi:diamine N-acetyltransferase
MAEIIETSDYGILAEMNEEIQTIHYELYPDVFKPYNNEMVEQAFEHFLSDSNAKAYIAMNDNVPVGYILFKLKDSIESAFKYASRTIYVDQVLVLENYKGAGIGESLLQKAYDFAKEHEVDRIELDHWSMNLTARYFFDKHGFQYYNEKMFKDLKR